MIGKYYYNSSKPRGEQLPWSVLTENIVKDARLKYYNHEYNIGQIAKMYDINYGTMMKAIRGLTWKHVFMPAEMIKEKNNIPVGSSNIEWKHKRGLLPKNSLLTNKQANNIRYLFSVRHIPISVIKESYGVRYDVIYKIVYGYTFCNAGGPIAEKSYNKSQKLFSGGELATC
jgi:predicted DNA-binding protein YlxM (UPF0122 family)